MLKLNGKEVSAARRAVLKGKIQEFSERTGHSPGLAVVLVGEDPASQVYVGGKIKACAEVGLRSFEHRLPEKTTPSELKELIEQLNKDKNVDGILVQLPLPKGLDSDEVLTWIDPNKDVDGLTSSSMGLLWMGKPRAISCTPAGVMAILDHYKLSVAGKTAVVVGRSNIVGKPMAHLLTQADATVTVCHSRTPDLSAHTRRADVVVVAAGRPRMLGKEDFKEGSIVIDVGIHRQPGPDGKSRLCGDVRFEELDGWVQAVTPVPGGVGPMTIAMLMENTLRLAELNCKASKA
ncbi:MAG: bifunctional methylenetetrahydrofolate dehydrogenase/methenyltetrahydrofolate cyclohydrolase FolD [Bdellovibrionales bacterium]|nr:bifunctional methylenetetrahydrofolate dehydrogenase/methenyltetrahydrofolate cyclohydrolase FolD [Bdellovibrionales bacterium]